MPALAVTFRMAATVSWKPRYWQPLKLGVDTWMIGGRLGSSVVISRRMPSVSSPMVSARQVVQTPITSGAYWRTMFLMAAARLLWPPKMVADSSKDVEPTSMGSRKWLMR